MTDLKKDELVGILHDILSTLLGYGFSQLSTSNKIAILKATIIVYEEKFKSY